MSKESLSKIYLVVEKIEYIEKIVEDAVHILERFDTEDVKGIYDARTYIAHDYEGVNLAIIEWIIRYGLPKFKTLCLDIIQNHHIN